MPRVLSEQEFNAAKARALASLPANLDEAGFNRLIGPAMAQALGEAENSPPTPEGSAPERLVGGVWKNVDPIAALEGLATAVKNPRATLRGIGQASAAEAHKAVDNVRQGRYVEAAGHGLAALPLIGPAAAAAGERIAQGDVAGGVGEGLGLLIPFGVAGKAAGAAEQLGARATQAARVVPGMAEQLDRLATLADRASTSRLVDVMAPKVGPNKTRFAGQAEKVAPQLARDADLAALSREGLHTKIAGKLADAQQALDEATDARLASQQVTTGPVLAKLDDEIAKLRAEPLEASRPVPALSGDWQLTPEGFVQGQTARPLGKAVEPAPNTSQLDTLRKMRSEIAALGPVASYEAVRRIRGAWDKVAKIKYMPATQQDALKAMGDATAAAKGTSVLRDALAATDPTTAAANADFSLYKTASDVLQATKEAEASRPRVGRSILTKVGGVVAGAQAAGAEGALAGGTIGALLDRASELAPTVKIWTARQFARAADLLRAGRTADGEAVVRQAAQQVNLLWATAKRGGSAAVQAETLALPTAAEDQTPERPPLTGRR